jgi:hypothetical protein
VGEDQKVRIQFFEELSIRRCADIHEATLAIVFSRKDQFSRNLIEEKEMKSRVSSAYDGYEHNV